MPETVPLPVSYSKYRRRLRDCLKRRPAKRDKGTASGMGPGGKNDKLSHLIQSRMRSRHVLCP